MEKVDLTKILRKLRSLMALQERPGTVAEAQSAAQRIAEICDKYRLDVAALPEEDLRQIVVEEEYSPPEIKFRRERWLIKLGSAVAQAHHCILFTFSGLNSVKFGGLQQDVEVAISMYAILVRSAQAIYLVKKKSDRKLVKNAFLLGFTDAICERYHQMMTAKNENESSQSLIRIVDSIVCQHFAGVPKFGGFGKAKPLERNSYEGGWIVGCEQDLNARLLKEGEQGTLLLEGGDD